MGIRIKQQDGTQNVKVNNPVQQSDIIVHTTGTSASLKANDNTDDLAIGLAKDWAIKTDGTVNGIEYSSKYYSLLAQEFVNEAMTPATSTKLGMVKVGSKLSVTEDGTLSANTYSTEELNSLLSDKADLSNIPTNVSELNNDSNYVTQTGLNNQLANYTAPLAPATSSILGGVKIGNGINVSSDGTISVSTRNIGEIVSSTLPLTDAGLHLLDGTLIQGNGIYSAFVDYIASIVSTYPSVFTTESAWQSSVSTYGVCGKFVYDSTNNTVRLPKVTGIIEGTTDVNALGDLIEAGLPQHTHTRGSMNITGKFGVNAKNVSGAFDVVSDGTGYSAVDGNNKSINFNAANSWSGSTSNANYTSTVNTSSTVQPQTIRVLYYIVVATSTKTDIQVDIDEITTDLNGKADVDMSNVSATAISKGYPKTYVAKAFIANGVNCTMSGVGIAYVKLYGNGLAEIHFDYQVTAAGTTNNFTLGLNSNLLRLRNSSIPQITPIGNGVAHFFNSNGSINNSLQGYAGATAATGEFWQMGRIYTEDGAYGGWPDNQFTVGTRVVGTCYGTYTVGTEG